EQRTRDLVALNQELDAFNYSVSHDLRAPLRGIDGFSQVLLEDYAGSLDDTARHYLTRVRAAAERMTALLDSLLRLSRLSRSDMRVERVDLSGIAADTLEALRVEAPDRAVTVTIEPGLFAYGDENLLRVVLSVLMENAWKFTRN